MPVTTLFLAKPGALRLASALGALCVHAVLATVLWHLATRTPAHALTPSPSGPVAFLLPPSSGGEAAGPGRHRARPAPPAPVTLVTLPTEPVLPVASPPPHPDTSKATAVPAPAAGAGEAGSGGVGLGSGTSDAGDYISVASPRAAIMPPLGQVPGAVTGRTYRVQFWVAADGRVTRVAIDPPIPDAGYRRDLVERMLACQFYPARTRSGTAVASVVTVPLRIGN